MINLVRISVVVIVIFVGACSVAPQHQAKCSLDRELQFVEGDQYREARAGFASRTGDPGASLALALMSEWRIGTSTSADVMEHRQRWEQLSLPVQELGASGLLQCA